MRRPVTSLFLFSGLAVGLPSSVGCLSPSPDNWDQDRDGTTRRVDCDDNDPDRSPGFPEICDGLDSDCLEGGVEAAEGFDLGCDVFFQQLRPCNLAGVAAVDIWRFEGPAVVTVDTVDNETRFDPAMVHFPVPGIHDDASGIADDDVPCTFDPPNPNFSFGCPRHSFGPGLWEIGVATYSGVSGSCADASLARYAIDFQGRWAELVANDAPSRPSWFPPLGVE